MKIGLVLFGLGVALATVLSADKGSNSPVTLPPVEPPVVTVEVDSAQDLYHENGGRGRAVAEIDARLLRHLGGASQALEHSLDVHIAAMGDEIEPMPGFRGFSGSNAITAREMETLLRDNRLAVSSIRESDSQVVDGSVREGRRGSLPVREVDSQGVLSTREVPALLELILDTGPLSPGTWVTTLKVDGVDRLQVVSRLEDDSPAILEISSLDPWSERY